MIVEPSGLLEAGDAVLKTWCYIAEESNRGEVEVN
jgi:hypothetical protein